MTAMQQYLEQIGSRKLFRRRRLRQAWLEVCDTLALLLDAGLPLPQSLRHVEQTANSQLARAIARGLAEEVTEGRSLTQYSEHEMPELLRLFFLASESSGTLPLGIRRWVDLVQQQRQWVSTLVRLVTYPVLLLVSTTLLLVFLWLKVLPTFKAMQQLVGARTSPAALWIERGIQWGGWFCLLAVLCSLGLLVWLLWARVKSPRAWDCFLFRSPFRNAVLAWRTRLFCLFLGTLLDAGVPVIDALSALGAAGHERWLRVAAAECEQRLLNGEGMTTAFGSQWHPLLLQALASAEQTGDLCGALMRIEQLVHALLLKLVQRWLRILEPVLIVASGTMVVACMMLLYVPMYDVIGQISGGGM